MFFVKTGSLGHPAAAILILIQLCEQSELLACAQDQTENLSMEDSSPGLVSSRGYLSYFRLAALRVTLTALTSAGSWS